MTTFVSWDSAQVQFQAIIEDRAFPLLLQTFLFALFAVLTLYFLWKKHKAASLLTFPPLVALTMFILFSVYWALGVYLLWAEVYTFLPLSQTTLPKTDSRWIYQPPSAPLYVQEVLQMMMILLGDTIALWRAYAIYGRPRWLYAVSGSILIIEIITSTLFCAARAADYLPLSKSSVLYSFFGRTKILWSVLAYGVIDLAQVTATISIAHKTWAHWRDVREFIHHSSTRHTLAMLLIILESGVVYLALLTWYATITMYGPMESAVRYTSAYYMNPLIAMYPTFVVVLVSVRHSVLEKSINMALQASFGMQFAEHASMREQGRDLPRVESSTG